MDNANLDQLIDEAARGIVQREPSQALTTAVMARVHSEAPPHRQGLLLWGSAVAASAVVAAMVASTLHRTPPMAQPNPSSAIQTAPAPTAAQTEPATTQNFVFEEQPGAIPIRTRVAAGQAAALSAEEDSPVAPIRLDPILAPQPLQVPDIDVASAPLDQIAIEPLNIEPISVSND